MAILALALVYSLRQGRSHWLRPLFGASLVLTLLAFVLFHSEWGGSRLAITLIALWLAWPFSSSPRLRKPIAA